MFLLFPDFDSRPLHSPGRNDDEELSLIYASFNNPDIRVIRALTPCNQ
jgi:hypothetical protein